MRQGQQGRRGRGRGRKVQNPLARNYESNGPDVKIRGNAAHIAEKYGTLARDAQASGDVITAENYFQHAEHYNRIIMAAQAQMSPGGPQPSDSANGSGGQRSRHGHGGEPAGQAQVTTPPDGQDTAAAASEGNGASNAAETTSAPNGSGHAQELETAKSSEDAPPDGAIV